MTPALHAGLAFAAGAVVAAVYCRLLWRSLDALPRARRPALAVLSGAAVRIALVVLALLAAGGAAWYALVAALAGFTLIRILVVTRVASRVPAAGPPA